MTGQNIPSDFAAGVKVFTDAVRDTFGAAITVIAFFGFALLLLASGTSNLGAAERVQLIYFLLGAMLFILLLLITLRLCRPGGLGGPPQATTEDVDFKNSTLNKS